MDILRAPLLNDEDRRRAFFEAMPELFLNELLNELVHKRYFQYGRLETLEEYDMLVKRGSFEFERVAYRGAYEDFRQSYEALMTFTKDHMIVEGNVVVFKNIHVEVDVEKEESDYYKELDDLCYEVADRYKRVVRIFSNESIKHEPKSYVDKEGNTLKFLNSTYTASSRRAKGMLSSLWDERVKKKDKQKAFWTSSENVALSMGLIKSSKDYTSDIWSKIDETRKSMNKRMKANGIEAEIIADSSKKLLFTLLD